MKKYFTFLLMLCLVMSCTRKKNIKDIMKEAEQGDPQAQFDLGYYYYNSEGLEESDEKAVYWWLEAANQGNSDAQYYLGTAYEKGKGVIRSYEKAVHWYTKAAEHGNTEAQLELESLL